MQLSLPECILTRPQSASRSLSAWSGKQLFFKLHLEYLLCTQTCTARALRAPALCTQIPCAVIQTYFPCAPRPTPLPHRRKQKPKRPSDVCNFIDSGIQNGI
eukprot:scaffold13145_cov21-Tisochrysis_lutea.AAC.3